MNTICVVGSPDAFTDWVRELRERHLDKTMIRMPGEVRVKDTNGACTRYRHITRPVQIQGLGFKGAVYLPDAMVLPDYEEIHAEVRHRMLRNELENKI
jgi:hypothetical protein